MKQLELKDICGYLPYGLVYQMGNGGISDFDDYTPVGNLVIYKPILRPLSDLYETITHNGKEIIPIVELAKIAWSDANWEYAIAFRNAVCNYRNRLPVHYTFNFSKDEGFSMRLYDKEGSSVVGFNNWYQLFDYLHELKIDYRGLIDKGLALSVHDLKTNPYQ